MSEWEFQEISGDLHSWVGDLNGVLTDIILSAAGETVGFVGDVAGDIGGSYT